MNDAIASWLEQRIACGCTRVEVWHLVTPHQHCVASYTIAAGDLAAIAVQIASLASSPQLPESVGHALFAYAGDGPQQTAMGLALLHGGELLGPGDRLLESLLSEAEMCARLVRQVEAAVGRR